jgi:neutral ceramidase
MSTKRLPFAIFGGLLLAAFACHAQDLSPDKRPDPVPLSNLRAGVAKVDITPPLGLPLAGYADRKGPATGIHDPLHAAVIVFDDGKTRSAIVTLDVLDAGRAEGDEMQAAIAAAAAVPQDHILINFSHTHGSPSLRRHTPWRREVIAKVVGAVQLAANRLRPVSLGYGEGAIDFNINRRVITRDGKCIAGLNPNGICDRRVKVLRVDDGDAVAPLAVLMHAVCHANVYRMHNTEVTADFPGVAKRFVESSFGPRTTALFLQGCSGDVRANLPGSPEGYTNETADFGRSGNEADMTWCGWTLGAEALKVATRLRVQEEVRQRSPSFPIAAAQDMPGIIADMDRFRAISRPRYELRGDERIDFPIRAMRLGDIWFVGLPGEPVVEYGLNIEKAMAGLGKVFVLGYTPGDVSYIPVARMLAEGGYEVEGGVWSQSSEQEILDGVQRLISQLR